MTHSEPDVLAGGNGALGRRIAAVKRVLLTRMSGTGKSSVIHALSARGFKAVDADDGWCEPLPDGRQRKAATHEIQTTMPLGDVVAEVLHPADA